MPIELHRLKLQLAILQVIIEDAIKNGKPFSEQTKIKRHTAWGLFLFLGYGLDEANGSATKARITICHAKAISRCLSASMTELNW